MLGNNNFRASCWGVVFFFSALFFTGCSNEDTVVGNEVSEAAIDFDCSVSNLRTVKSITSDMQYFRVSAVWNKGGSNYESFMDNQLVEKQNDSWVYSPVKHWPGYGSVSFFAYSPAISSGIKLFNIDGTANQLTIGYELSTDYQKQEDFMVAVSPEKKASPILLNFNHVLSSVSIKARSNELGVTFRIKEIKFTNLYSKALFTCTALNTTTPFWGWYEQIDSTEYLVYQKYPFETSDTYKEVGSLMVIPQKKDQIDNPGSSFKITVLCDIIGVAEDKIGEYTLDKEFEFEMGKRYTFYLDLNSQFFRSQKQGARSLVVKCHIVSELNEK